MENKHLYNDFVVDLLKVARLYRAHVDKALETYGLSQATAFPLVVIGRLGDGVKQIDLADALHIEGPSLVRILDQLEAAALLERRADSHDRRVKQIFLTAAGRRMQVLLEDEIHRVRQLIFEGIRVEDLKIVLEVFTQIKCKIEPVKSLLSGSI